MALERQIIKASVAESTTFEYKPRELAVSASTSAKDFVAERSNDFKISELVAQQAGISQLESDAHQDKINTQVLARLAEVQEKSYTEGYEIGLIEGTEKAFQEAKANLLERMTSLESMLKTIEDIKTKLLITNEAEIIKLIFLTAKKIALRDLESNREAAYEIIRNVTGETQADERVIVRLSGEDLYFIETLQEKSGQKIEALERIKFVADESVKPGGCLIETEYGTVNATVEERVERVWQTLQSKIPQQNPGKKE